METPIDTIANASGSKWRSSPLSTSARWFVLAVALTGCMTRTEGTRLQTAARDQSYRVSELEEQVKTMQLELDEARQRLATLDQTATSASRVSADLLADFNDLQERAASLQGTLDSLRQVAEESRAKQRELEQKVDKRLSTAGGEVNLTEEDIPQSPEGIMQKASTARGSGQYAEARALYRAFVRRHPRDARAGEAQYLVAKTYLEQGKPATALGELRNVLKNYPDGPHADDTLFDMGKAFFDLQACGDAKAAFQALIKQYRSSELRDQAKEELKRVRAAPRSQCRG